MFYDEPKRRTIVFQRLEAVCIFIASLFFYFYLQYTLIWLVLLILSVDVFMAGYLTANNRVGAFIYNLGHSYLAPPFLLTIGVLASNRILIAAGIIWIAHIAMDRMFGYGLKLDTGFKHTHLGEIGKE